MSNENDSEQCDWEQDVGLKEETTYVAIYPARSHAEAWMDEANKQGYQSRSRYLIELIQEARATRHGTFSASEPRETRVEELKGEIDRLETELEETRQSPRATNGVSEIIDLDTVLTAEFQSLNELVDATLETDALREGVKRDIEDALFEHAKKDAVEYKSGFGWRLSSETEGDT